MNDFKLHNRRNIDPGFIVPENYFDHFSQRIMEQLPQPEAKVIPLHDKKTTWIYAAAAVLVLALSIPILNRLSPSVAAPDQTALENYIASHSEISDDVIVELLETEDIEKIKIDYNLEDKAIEDVLSSNSSLETIIN